MKYNDERSHRHSIRLKGYDYSQNGMYFVTICVQNREYLFGEIIDQKMALNDTGKMIDLQWNELPKRFNHIQLDEYIVMPNHFHGIITVGAPLVGALVKPMNGVSTRGAPTHLSNIVGAFKSITTCEYINSVKKHNYVVFNKRVWQRNYYDHIIRNENALDKIREYIINNPINWPQDEMNTTTI